MGKKITTTEAAERLKVSTARVRQLILWGQLPAEKFGRDHMIREADLKLVEHRPLGRPPQKKKPRKVA